jgi:hypothetical protein
VTSQMYTLESESVDGLILTGGPLQTDSTHFAVVADTPAWRDGLEAGTSDLEGPPERGRVRERRRGDRHRRTPVPPLARAGVPSRRDAQRLDGMWIPIGGNRQRHTLPVEFWPVRDYHDITIGRVALHVVAPRAGKLETTDEELDRPVADEIAAFLAGHVERGLHDPQARAARFIVPGPDRAQGAADSILASSDALLTSSGQLASLLYKASKGDERVSDATLAVVVCAALDRADSEKSFVALVKLDPSSQFRTQSREANGRRKITLEREAGILPSVNERLQKAAFIRADTEGDEFRMLLVDRQRERDVVSDFFVSKFLDAELVLDTRKRSEILWREVHNARNAIQDSLTAEQLTTLDGYIWGSTLGTAINLDTFEDQLPIENDDARAAFIAHLDTLLPDREFELDQDLMNKVHRRRTFAGDNGLRVSLSSEYFIDMVDVDDDPNRPGGTIVTIKTMTWSEKS